MIRILLVDDQNLIRQGLQALLEPRSGLKVVGAAEDGEKAIKQVETLKPDIVLVDIEMPRMDGLTATQKICQQFPKTKVIILSGHVNEEYAAQALKVGAKGYLLKSALDRDLEEAIRAVHQGHLLEPKSEEKNATKKPAIPFIYSNLLQSQKTVKSANKDLHLFLKLLQKNGISLKLIKLSTIGIISVLLILAVTLFRFSNYSTNVDSATNNSISKSQIVVALGRIKPKGEIIKLSIANAEDSRVNKILVEEGDFVVANQVVAILQGINRKEKDLEEAQKAVEYYQAKLEQIRQGDSKQAEIAAQRANIASLEAQLSNEKDEREAALASAKAQLRQAQLTYKRQQSLRQQGAVSQETLDLAREEQETAKANVAEKEAQFKKTVQTLGEQVVKEKENLASLQEVRPVDVKVAEKELERALVSVEQRQADIEDTKVQVPIAGQILRVNTRVGEKVNTEEGIVELGQTDQMYVIAEIYETDIAKVNIGQTASIESEYGGFEQKLSGVVEHIGLQIGTQKSLDSSTDPTKDENTRVVEVKIRFNPEDSQKVTRLTNMQVRVKIDTES